MDNIMKSCACVVPGCKNTDQDKFLKFYLLPYKEQEILKEWIVRIRNPTLHKNLHEGKSKQEHKICEIHFHYACKTEFNSGLHPLSLPTLHLPNLDNADKPIYYNNMLDESVATKMDCDDEIHLQSNMCPEICRVCYKSGLLYYIENSTYKKDLSIASIINYLVPEYGVDKKVLKERICLDCVKQILISYLTVKQIKSTSNIFSYLSAPQSYTRLDLRGLVISYQHKIDMKSILADCNLICCTENNKKYLPKKNVRTSTKKDVRQKTSKALLESTSKLTSRSNTPSNTSLNATTAENSSVNKTIKQYSIKRKNIDQNTTEVFVKQEENIDIVENNFDTNDVKIDFDQTVNDEADSQRTTEITEHDLDKVKREVDIFEGASCVINSNIDGLLFDQSKLINEDFEENDMPDNLLVLGELNNTEDGGHFLAKIQAFSSISCNEINGHFACEKNPDLTEHLKMNKPVKFEQVICKNCGVLCDNVKAYYDHLKRKKTDKNTVIPCPHCDKNYNSKKNFLAHMHRAHGPRKECSICQKEIPERDLRRHIKVAHESENTRCMECNVHFNTMPLLSRHLLECHPNVCLICSKVFSSTARIRSHMLYHCLQKEEVECNLCQRKFKNKFALCAHMRSRNKTQLCAPSKRVFKRGTDKLCPICGKTVRFYSRHMFLKHSTTKHFKCDQCAYETNYSGAIQRHKLQHAGYKPFLCTECGQSFSQKVGLEAHVAKQHKASAEPIKCKYCDESFNTRYDRNVHAQKHGVVLHRAKGIRNTPNLTKQDVGKKLKQQIKVCCLQCNEQFKSTFRLRVHIIEKHEKITGFFICKFCNKRFDKYANMYNHTRCVHIKSPDRVCTICAKSFLSRKHLEIHMRAHSDERPFSCDICPSKFKTMHHLQSHITRVHEDKRPFPCTFCSKAFGCKTSLKEHVRTHTGERLTCDYCDKTFAGQSNQSKHLQTVHNIRRRHNYKIKSWTKIV